MVEIEMEAVTKHFGKVTALSEVTLTVGRGELFFLLGPSGCGKTTLLRLVAGFLEADGGGIRFDGRSMDGVPAQKRNTAMVFQNYALWPHMTVFRNVRYGLDIQQMPRAQRDRRVHEILALVRMTGFEDRYPAELSGGQQQRVALARALVVEPVVVLLDEPLSNLDAKLRLEMRAEIKRIHQRTRRTAVYVTHDQKEALSMADRIAVMNDGRVLQLGTPEEVYTRPTDLFCARFIGNCNVIKGTVREVEGGRVVVHTALGALTGEPGPLPLEAGDTAAVTIRPELLRRASTDETVSFVAKVVSRMYLGEMVRYDLAAGDVELVATLAGGADWHAAAGDEVRLTYDPDQAIVFPTEN